jgi:anti-sigma regulatory factor (Ser/Thr protein kinase)
VLYTDGLIESRQRDIDAGLTAMRKVLADADADANTDPGTGDGDGDSDSDSDSDGDRAPGSPHASPPLEAVCDSLVEALLPERAEDDAALLVARTRALPAAQVASWDLPPEPAVVAGVRARAARQLAAWGLEEMSFTTELIVSELLTNAIRHAEPPIRVRMILDGELSCEVSDGSSTAPHLRRADRYDEGGRGLLLVAQLADRWGSRLTATGKTIWSQQPLPPGRAA